MKRFLDRSLGELVAPVVSGDLAESPERVESSCSRSAGIFERCGEDGRFSPLCKLPLTFQPNSPVSMREPPLQVLNATFRPVAPQNLFDFANDFAFRMILVMQSVDARLAKSLPTVNPVTQVERAVGPNATSVARQVQIG